MPIVRLTAVTHGSPAAGKSSTRNSNNYVCLADSSVHKSVAKARRKLVGYIRLTKGINNFEPEEFRYMVDRILFSDEGVPMYVFYRSNFSISENKICKITVVGGKNLEFKEISVCVLEEANKKWNDLKRFYNEETDDHIITDKLGNISRSYSKVILK